MILRYLWKYKFRYLIGLITLFLVDRLSLRIPEITGHVVDGLTYHTLGFQGVLTMIGSILLLALGISIGRFCWRYFILGAAKHIEYELRNDLFDHLSKLSPRFYNDNKTGDIMALFTNDISVVRVAIGPAVITTFDAIVMTVMVVIQMILYVDLNLTLIACIPMLCILLGGLFYGKAIENRFEKKQEAYAQMTDFVQENVSGVRVIKAFVQEDKEIETFKKVNEYNKEKNLAVVRLQATVLPLLDLLIGLSTVVAILIGGKLVLNGKITPGEFITFNQYLLMLVWPMIASGDSITYISQGRASIKRLAKIFSITPEIKDDSKTDQNKNQLSGEITLSHLSFAYQDDLVLDDISVHVKPGETLAVIGMTGSGKSTIANLLLRMYDVSDNMIKLDETDIKKIPLSVLREQIAYVPQDNFLFSDTVQSNIAFGVRKLSSIPHKKVKFHLIPSKNEQEEAMKEYNVFELNSEADAHYDDLGEVRVAAQQACVDENVMEFPRQYATMVGERGVTISGGQKQRCSIARALMKDAKILILDDALSAVDTNTEEQILKNLKEVRKNKTTILIAHRISTIQHADHIMVLNHGRMIEYGTHKELLANNQTYAGLYHKQQLEQQLEEA